MCGKDKDKDKPPALNIGEPPPLQEMMDVIDEITGTQSVIVTGADGKKRRVNSRLPRTGEEKKRFELAEQLIPAAMQAIQKLYKYDPQSMIDFAPLVDTFANIDEDRMKNLSQVADLGNIRQDVTQFKQIQNSLIDEEFAIQRRANEETLAHTGRGSGTYAAESRAAMARNHSLALQEADIKASNYGLDLASKRLGIGKETFGLNEIGRKGQLESAQGQYGVLKADEADQNARRLGAIEEQKGMYGMGREVVQDDLNKALQNTNVATAHNEYQITNAAQLNRYRADMERQKMNHDAAVQAKANEKPSFMQTALNTGLRLGAAYFTGGMSEVAMAGANASQGSGGGGGGSMFGMDQVGRMGR